IEVPMKAASTSSQFALATLVILMLGATTVWAQGPKGKVVPPPPPPPRKQEPPPPLPAKPVADKLAPVGWTRYEVGEPARFSLILPAEPSMSVERMNMAPGVAVTARAYLSSTDSGVYGATYVDDLPATILNEATKRTFFEGFVKGFAQGFQEGMKANGVAGQLQMLEQRTATASGLAGYERDFSFDKLTGRVRLVFDGGRAYAVMAFWNALSSNSERSTFFESLKINRKH
ncbi:MAG: hypothetical protein LC747_08655, partial [Acidobacteria bacterium]|nr:hypothetical protein [Acidobacteriota bacterium]